MTFASSRAPLVALLSLAIASAVLSGVSPADELNAGSAARGLTIHGPEETLRQYCASDSEGRLWFRLPSGASFELITSIHDPAISNPGDGAFHPFDEAEVRAALGAVRFPLGAIHVDIFILPFPRRRGMESAAGSELILLSPGVRPLSREHQHAELVHELGHVVQYAMMPDTDAHAWQVYRDLRSISDASVDSAGAVHANRPHEIFAEDFRALFGDPLATATGTIENSSLQPPARVQGLEQFFLGLSESGQPLVRLVGYPNPSHGRLRFARPGTHLVTLDVFDPAGRRVAILEPVSIADRTEWNWDGRDAGGRPVGPGVLWARPHEPGSTALRITLTP